MTTFVNIRTHLLDAFLPRLSEWWCAVILGALGAMLSANPDLMLSTKTQAYQLMLMIATQETWALAMKCFAALRLAILFINGTWSKSPHLRALTAFMSMFFWTQIFLSFAPTFGYACILTGGVLALDFLNVIRAARDARLSDYKHAGDGSKGGQG